MVVGECKNLTADFFFESIRVGWDCIFVRLCVVVVMFLWVGLKVVMFMFYVCNL